MRGTVAKRIRDAAAGDRKELKRIKKLYKSLGKPEPKLPKRTRWSRSPVHFAKMTTDGIHRQRNKPLKFIADIFLDLSAHGKLAAINLSKQAERLSRPELRTAIRQFKETHVNVRIAEHEERNV
jgi:hypothetical protein